MKYGLKYKIFRWIFKYEIEELNHQIYYLIKELDYQNRRNSNLEKSISEYNKKLRDSDIEISILIKELQNSKDKIDSYEEIINNLYKENKISTMILQALKLYKNKEE